MEDKQTIPADEWLEKKGYPLTMPMTRDNLAIIINRYNHENPVSPQGQWISVKPEFKEDCLLITANYFKSNDHWDYTLFEIKKTDGYEDKWYWGIFEDGDEWGDIADLKADKYLVLNSIPQPPTKP